MHHGIVLGPLLLPRCRVFCIEILKFRMKYALLPSSVAALAQAEVRCAGSILSFFVRLTEHYYCPSRTVLS